MALRWLVLVLSVVLTFGGPGISQLESAAGAYDADDNHDPDGDSNGTTIGIDVP